MNKKILVPLGQYDRSEEMIPYIENVARPGMGVVFLVRYPVDGFIWAKEEYGMRAALRGKEVGELLFLGREPRKREEASSSRVRSSARQRHRSGRGCLRR